MQGARREFGKVGKGLTCELFAVLDIDGGKVGMIAKSKRGKLWAVVKSKRL